MITNLMSPNHGTGRLLEVNFMNLFHRLLLVFITILFSFGFISPTALALSDEQRSLYNQNILYYDLASEKVCSGVELTGSDNAEKIWNFFISQGFTPEQAAGFLGNFSVETGGTFDPGTEQVGGNGYGIAQWDDRRTTLEAYAQQQGQPVDSLELQLDFVMHELKGSESAAYELIKATETVTQAWEIISRYYERPLVWENPERGAEAQKFYDLFAGTGNPATDGEGTGKCVGENGSSGEVIDGVAWPVPKKWWNDHPEYFSGPHHDYPALDIAVPTGTEVYSILDGTVVSIESSGACGGGVIIDTNNARVTYCHGPPGSVRVSAGDKVSAGQLIMLSNDTGSSQGAHLHLQIEINGSLVCPQDIFKNLGQGKGTNIESLPTSGCIS